MRTITFVVVAFILSGCATVFKGYLSDVEISTPYPDSLHVYLKEGVQVSASYKILRVSEVDTAYPMARIPVMHWVDRLDPKKEIIQLRSNKDQTLLIKSKTSQQKYVAYAKLGAGWFILDLICGGVPIIVDAVTGNWNYFDDIQYQSQ